MRTRAFKTGACLGLLTAAIAVGGTYADDSSKAEFLGTWRTAPGAERRGVAEVVFAPGEGGVSVTGDVLLDGVARRFAATAPAEGDVLSLDADLGAAGIVRQLSGDERVASETLHARFLLDRSAGRIEASWRTTSGRQGRETLSQSGTGWAEKPLGGSAESEAAAIADLVRRITKQQDEVKKGSAPERGFHNKGFGVKAELRVAADLAPDLRVGLFQPGAVYPAIARFSNAGASSTNDLSPDQRGLAFRVKPGHVARLLSGETADAQDFLTTNSPITTRDPVQFLDTARALTVDKKELVTLKKKYGTAEALYAITHLAKGTAITRSMAGEKLWSSRAPLKWGRLAVKVALTPASVPSRSLSDGSGVSGFFKGALDRLDVKDGLREDMKLRLANGDVVLDMWVQRFSDEETTPIEDGSIEWKTPLEKVGQLVIPRNADLDDATSAALAAEIEKMAFNPWNCTEDFRPLGSLMRARKEVYKASAGHRGACPFGFLHR